jgi:hypothetical protein
MAHISVTEMQLIVEMHQRELRTAISCHLPAADCLEPLQ